GPRWADTDGGEGTDTARCEGSGGRSDEAHRLLRPDALPGQPVAERGGVAVLDQAQNMVRQVRAAGPADEQDRSVEPVQAGGGARGVHRRAADHRRDVVGEEFAGGARGLEREQGQGPVVPGGGGVGGAGAGGGDGGGPRRGGGGGGGRPRGGRGGLLAGQFGAEPGGQGRAAVGGAGEVVVGVVGVVRDALRRGGRAVRRPAGVRRRGARGRQVVQDAGEGGAVVAGGPAPGGETHAERVQHAVEAGRVGAPLAVHHLFRIVAPVDRRPVRPGLGGAAVEEAG